MEGGSPPPSPPPQSPFLYPKKLTIFLLFILLLLLDEPPGPMGLVGPGGARVGVRGLVAGSPGSMGERASGVLKIVTLITGGGVKRVPPGVITPRRPPEAIEVVVGTEGRGGDAGPPINVGAVWEPIRGGKIGGIFIRRWGAGGAIAGGAQDIAEELEVIWWGGRRRR